MRPKFKNYKIFRHDVFAESHKFKDDEKARLLRWKYADAFSKFKMQTIDKFCSLNFKELAMKYGIGSGYEKYEKEWIFGPFDIGFDMLEVETGLIQEHQWSYIYFWVPLDRPDMVKYFEEVQLPYRVKVVTRI